MSTTLEPPAPSVASPAPDGLRPADGVELLGPVHGCGYRDGAALVRRADGQMVQLGALMYGLLECADGRRDSEQLATALSQRLGRRVEERHVARLTEKLAAQGLLAGSEHRAPPRRHPLLALRWKVLVTNPRVTRLLTAPFAVLFRPWILWPALACFVATLWFVLIHKGVASATAQAFHRPGLLLLVFVLAVASAGLHEFGHAAACRYGGATPGGMGMGLYMVWPAFYTDVTDSYRLPKRDRLRVDLGGLYFNAVVAVVTMGVWLVVWRADALLLLVGLQVLQMVKQLSPVIRADGYHILSDATGVPDLYAQMGPTLRRLLPGHRHEPSALTGRARALVTVWVLVVVPVIVCLSLSAVLLLPRLATTAWDSGHQIAAALPADLGDGRILDALAALVRLFALALPVLGTVLVTQRIVRTTSRRALSWSRGRAGRQVVVALATFGILAGLAWAWWPSGQYQPVRARQGGTVTDLGRLVAAPASVARPTPAVAPVALAPGRHLAMAMIPVGGATRRHPALFVVSNGKGRPTVAILSTTAPAPDPGTPTMAAAPSATPVPAPSGPAATTTAPPQATQAVAFPFQLPKPPGPGGTQAVAVGKKDGGVTYDVAYSVVTVKHGAPVTNTNSAFALASCRACTTVAVSFQVVLIVGESHVVAPVNAAGALNVNCPACVTTALADQMVITVTRQPSQKLLDELNAALKKLGALSLLGAGGTPQAVAAEVAAVQQQIQSELNASGLLVGSGSSSTSTQSSGGGATTTTGTTTSSTTPAQTTSTTPASTQTQTTTPGSTTTTPAQTTTTTTPSSTTTTPTTTTTTQTTPTTTTTTSTTPTTTTTTSTTPTTTTP